MNRARYKNLFASMASANIAASAKAVPRHIEEFATSIPVNSQIIVWNSKIACNSLVKFPVGMVSCIKILSEK